VQKSSLFIPGFVSHIPINEVQTKMHYYNEANYPSPITSYKFAINNSFNVEIATEILYIIMVPSVA
jgi:hypothetical protein